MVLRQADLAGEALANQRGDVVGAPLVGRQDLEADAIDTHEGAALGQLANRRHIGLLVLVTDEDPTEIGAAVGEEVLLHVAVLGVLGVRDDREPDLALREPAAPVRQRSSAGVTSTPVAALIAPAWIPPVPAMPSASSRTYSSAISSGSWARQ